MDFVPSRWRRTVAALMLAGVLFTISACSDATGPNDYNASLAPGTGSLYAVEFFNADAFGNIVGDITKGVQDSIRPVVYSYTSPVPLPDSLLPFGGVKNILQFDVPGGVSQIGTIQDRYFRYLSNGNVLVYVDSMKDGVAKLDSFWLELPFGTKSSRSWTEVDTTWIPTGSTKPNTLKITWAVNFDKVETLLKTTAPGRFAQLFRTDASLTALRAYIHRERLLTDGNTNKQERIWSEDTYWFAPKIKYVVQKTHGHMTITTNLTTGALDTVKNDPRGNGYLWTAYYYNVK